MGGNKRRSDVSRHDSNDDCGDDSDSSSSPDEQKTKKKRSRTVEGGKYQNTASNRAMRTGKAKALRQARSLLGDWRISRWRTTGVTTSLPR
eukprot:1180537-Prorocentrum_minimum.AAC.2